MTTAIARNKSDSWAQKTQKVANASVEMALTMFSIMKISKQFRPVIATTEEEKDATFKLRYTVFAEELGLEPLNDSRRETNHSDVYSTHCLMRVVKTEQECGTVRLVMPKTQEQLLPIEEYCIDSITEQNYHPSRFERNEICEVSRLAIPSFFRRRDIDDVSGAALGAYENYDYTKADKRSFPFIAVLLYMTTAALAVKSGKKHIYVMVEPRLARRMKAIGINCVQIGDVIEYHGKRAPFYISPEIFESGLKLPFRHIYKKLLKSI
jgi:N-acyl amino acid synthase of PEP-CTERM/exosortase system